MYLEALFSRKRIYKFLENSKILNGKNNLHILPCICIPMPEFIIASIQFSDLFRILIDKKIHRIV